MKLGMFGTTSSVYFCAVLNCAMSFVQAGPYLTRHNERKKKADQSWRGVLSCKFCHCKDTFGGGDSTLPLERNGRLDVAVILNPCKGYAIASSSSSSPKRVVAGGDGRGTKGRTYSVAGMASRL